MKVLTVLPYKSTHFWQYILIIFANSYELNKFLTTWRNDREELRYILKTQNFIFNSKIKCLWRGIIGIYYT